MGRAITCITYWPAYVPVMVELCPDARRATAKSFELHLPRTFCNRIRMWFKIPNKDQIEEKKYSFCRMQLVCTINRKDALFKSRSWQLARTSGFRPGALQTAPLTDMTDMFIRNAIVRAKALSIM